MGKPRPKAVPSPLVVLAPFYILGAISLGPFLIALGPRAEEAMSHDAKREIA